MNKLVSALLLASTITLSQAQELVVNPYENVRWESIQRYKANFHTHTNNSDGSFNAEFVTDTYAANGYSILVLTDHSQVTYPWTAFSTLNPKWQNRNADSLHVLTFPGNELSSGHHRNVFFARINGGGTHLDSTFQQITDSSALCIFNHPGRYWDIKKEYQTGEKYSPEWYIDFFHRYPCIVGMEVYNCPEDRYPCDRILWDEILDRTMPQRPVWGYSNDDMHGKKQLMGNYNYMLIPKLTIDHLRQAMKSGHFYVSNEPGKTGEALAPHIVSVQINTKAQTITIDAKDCQKIRWISGIKGEGEKRINHVVAEGKTFHWKGFSKSYVRCELINSYGTTLTQPFGFSR